jgi:tRNA dimethylallyltransferase
LAVDLAKKFDGEIINGDAVQMYEGLPIITNKLSISEQQGIPHHLLGVIKLEDPTWTVATFKQHVGHLIQDISSRGKLPILVGGTHYYTQALLFNDSLLIDFDTETSPKVEATAAVETQTNSILQAPTSELLERLRQIDPTMADRWHPNDRRKIQRSLEIYLTSGKRASDVYSAQKTKSNQSILSGTVGNTDTLLSSTLLFWLHADTKDLHPRLDARVGKMLEDGLIDEVKSLYAFNEAKEKDGQVVDQSRGLWVSIGYKEFVPYLKALYEGKSPDEVSVLYNEATERTKIATRQYARRQIRWISNKLVRSLRREGHVRRLHVLDGSKLENWSEYVSGKATSISGSFLKNGFLPEPSPVPEAVVRLFGSEGESSSGCRGQIKFYCETCQVTTVTQIQKDAHLKSRGHRKRLASTVQHV